MRAYERLLNYVRYDTASDENSPTCPSTKKQLALAEALVEELRSLGVDDARVDEHGYVDGSIPANAEGRPAIGLIAHMDVVDCVPSAPVRPAVIVFDDGGVHRGAGHAVHHVHVGDQPDGGEPLGVGGDGAVDVAVFVDAGVGNAHGLHLLRQRVRQHQLLLRAGAGGAVFVRGSVVLNVVQEALICAHVFLQ